MYGDIKKDVSSKGFYTKRNLNMYYGYVNFRVMSLKVPRTITETISP